MNVEITKIKNIITNHQFNSNEEFFKLIDTLKELANQLQNPAEKASTLAFVNNRIAYYSINEGKYDYAIELLESNLHYANNANDNEIKLLTYNTYAILHSSLDNYTDALRYYLKAYDLALLVKDKFTEAKILNNIGDLFLISKAYEKGLDYFLKASEIINTFDINNNVYAKLVCEENLCIAYINLKKYELAKEHFKECQQLADFFKIDSIKILLYSLNIAINLNQHKAVEIPYNKLISSINSSTEDTFNMIESFQIAVHALIDNDYQERASKLIKRFTKIIHKVNSNREFMNFYAINLKYLLKFCPDEQDEINYYYQQYFICSQNSSKSKNEKMFKSLSTELKFYHTHKQHVEVLAQNNQLFQLSYNDDLTKLHNRLAFNNHLDNILNNPQVIPLALLFIDIDYFKEYNDTYGHLEGDKALIKVASILNNEKNNNIIAFRYGGDEFTIIMLTDKEDEVISYIDNVNQKLADLKIPNKNSLSSDYVTISVGYFLTTNRNITKDEIIKNADDAVYSAKKSGRNCYKNSQTK